MMHPNILIKQLYNCILQLFRYKKCSGSKGNVRACYLIFKYIYFMFVSKSDVQFSNHSLPLLHIYPPYISVILSLSCIYTHPTFPLFSLFRIPTIYCRYCLRPSIKKCECRYQHPTIVQHPYFYVILIICDQLSHVEH